MKRSMSKEEFLGLQCVLYRMLTEYFNIIAVLFHTNITLFQWVIYLSSVAKFSKMGIKK